MDAREISFEDLVQDEDSSASQLPSSVDQVLAEGFPVGGGLEALEAIAGMSPDSARHAALPRQYRQLLELQRAGQRRR
jgi:hypothetical protein